MIRWILTSLCIALLGGCGGGSSSAPPPDVTPPTISLLGANPQLIATSDPYVELGVVATDDTDGDISSAVMIDSSGVDVNTVGNYVVIYDVIDSSGNMAATVFRDVNVVPRAEISFAFPTSIGNESQLENITLLVNPIGQVNSSVSLLVSGTAANGTDYDSPSTPLAIPAGVDIVNLPIDIHSDLDTEVGETVEISLVAPCESCDISTTDFMHVVTLDDWRGTVHVTSTREMVVETMADDANSGPIIGGIGSGQFEGVSLDRSGFVAKLNREGGYEWVTEVLPAGSQTSSVLDVVLISDDSILATGFRTASGESKIVFLSELNSSGVIQWTTILGSSEEDIGYAIAQSASGDIYVAGRTSGNLDGPSAGSCDLFTAKFDSSGNHIWTRQVGSTTCDAASGAGISITNAGNVITTSYVTGPVNGVPIQGTQVVIVLGYNDAGQELWRTFIDSGADATSERADAHPGGGAIISGFSGAELEPGKIKGPFIAKISDAGTVDWLTQHTELDSSSVNDLLIDDLGNIQITGHSFGDFTGTGNAGVVDVFVLSFNQNGDFRWSQQFGGMESDWGEGIGTDSTGAYFVSGWSRGDLLGLIDPGHIHSFIIKLNDEGAIH